MMEKLPTIPGVTLFLDETGEHPRLVITTTRDMLTRRIVRLCHALAGNCGAAIEFRVAP